MEQAPDTLDLAARALAEALPRPAALLDDELRLLWANPAFAELEATLRSAPLLQALEDAFTSGRAEMTLDVAPVGRFRFTARCLSEWLAPARLLLVAEPLSRPAPLTDSAYRDLVENAPFGIFVATPEGGLLDANPALAGMLGYPSVEELCTASLAGDVFRKPEQHRRFVDVLERRGRVVGLEPEWKRRDGTLARVRLTGRALTDAAGTLRAYEGIAEDVTDRRQLEEQSQQSQKMEAVGRLAGGVAHDFNNLLTIIRGNIGFLTEGDTAEADRRDAVYEIEMAAERATRLTRQLLAFSRKQRRRPRTVDVNASLLELLRMARRIIGEDIELRTRLATDLGRVRVDTAQFEQVVMNLVVNARDAMPNGGRLDIETQNVEIDKAYVRSRMDARLGEHVRIRVRDNGCGMDAETRARVFEPFFTTKSVGTGLGLATVYGVVSQSGGHVTVESEVGEGTAFDIYLPRVRDDVPRKKDAPGDGEAVRASGETVLVVEDEFGVRSLAARILNAAGYRVLQAADADEAEEVLAEHVPGVDLVLTDVVMPGRSGAKLGSRVNALWPGTPVLYMSGYNDERVGEDMRDCAAFLEKPFDAPELLGKVREFIRKRPSRDPA